MRQVHPAGERLFVDYAGQTVELVDGRIVEIGAAQVFVAVLGASSYTYAEATLTQTLPDWIGAHVRALAFFGGVPRQIVPDNFKAGVLKANWHEPGLNPTYQDFATHYGTAILPARPRRPRDKAKVEVGVQVVERWILARLRNQREAAGIEHRRPRRRHPAQPPSPRAGLPRLHGHPPPCPPVRRRPPRGGLPPRPRDRCAILRLDQLDPRYRARSPALRSLRPSARTAARPSQHPRFPLLPLRRQILLAHPTVDQLVKLGLAGMARAFTEMQGNHSAAALDHAEWLALLLEREATERSNRQLIARLRHAKLRQRATIEGIDWRAPRSPGNARKCSPSPTYPPPLPPSRASAQQEKP